MAEKEEKCILMEFDYWNNSPLSIAKYYGGIRICHRPYHIVGEKLDLVREDFVAIYKWIGRDKFLEIIRENHQASPTELKQIFKNIK